MTLAMFGSRSSLVARSSLVCGLALVALALAGQGCGGAGAGSSSQGGGAQGGGGQGQGASSQGGQSAGGAGGGGAAPLPTKGGGVYGSSLSFESGGTPITNGSVSASFYDIDYPDELGTCVTTTAGACTLWTCELATQPSTFTYRSAGTLTVTGGVVDVSMEKGGDFYGFNDPAEVLFVGGESLTVAASGDEVPAFSTALVAPELFELLSPELLDGTVVSRAQDFGVTWEQGLSHGTVAVSLSGTYEPADLLSAYIECTAPASDGALVVPSSLLLELPSGAGTFSAVNREVVELDAGDYPVRVAFSTIGAAPSSANGLASGVVTLE
jgi:hypothetical protein